MSRSREKYDRLSAEYVRQHEKLQNLRALVERGEGGEKKAAANALRDQRISTLEAKLDALYEWARLRSEL